MNGRAKKFRFLPFIGLGLVVLLVGGGAIWLVRNFLAGAPPAQKKVAQEIHIIRPPPEELPPPPPPPPPEEKVDITDPQQPDPTPSDEPPPSEQLGLDAEGGAGADGFGLLGRKGGRDLLASGGSVFAWYTGLLKNEILSRLQDDKKARAASYSIVVRVWLKPDGGVEKVKLTESTGDRELDRAIEVALASLNRIPQAPPLEMPQPVSLKIVSRI